MTEKLNTDRKKQAMEAFGRLLDIMDDLRGQCPWDMKQTMESLRYLSIEEIYELSDAILEKDMEGVKKELGDLMLHLVFYAKIGSETQAFDIGDVLDDIAEKLIHRHPHIYGDVEVADAEEVKQNWEKLKLAEGRESVLDGVPGSMPPLVKACRIQEKARGVGFDWDHADQVWEKVHEEIHELEREVAAKSDSARVEAEFGDLLFSLVNYARFIGVNPEDALERTNKKFIQRFRMMESWVREDGRNLQEMSLEEMDRYWDRAKEEGLI